eukprot:TRINITY_DN82_c1_g1_i1.p1 TRINITY_DN82_c1_g1~~TRINITY_DN82_c1_g1_i1.p1  ORF type:complete len:169 (+),score=39.01 TRINITY_DN82_c1_g1_i1:43-507(+)
MKVLIILALLVCLSYADMSKYYQRKAKAFMENVATKEGVISTASGLAYKVLETGTGTTSPTKSDKVLVHYKGTLIDGTQFDSSYDRGQPLEFGVTDVIPGWTEVLQLMHTGDIFEVYIPWQLAYGEHGAGATIPGYQALIFKVELLKINGKDEL